MGTVVLRLIRSVMIPPTVSMPSRGKEEQRQEKEDPESSRSCHRENGGLDCDTTGDSLRDDALVGFLAIEKVEDGFDDMRNTSGTTTKTIS